MPIPLLIVGTAYDGPAETPIRLQTIDEAFSLFGGYVYERKVIGPTETSCSLANIPAGAIQILEENGPDLVPFPMFDVSVTDNVVSFSQIGTTREIIFKYLRNIEITSATSVYKAFAEIKSTVGHDSDVWVTRVEGSTATLNVSTTDGTLTLESVYGGSLYNSAKVISVNVTSASGQNVRALKLVPPAGHGTTKYVLVQNDDTTAKPLSDIAEEINLLYAKGYCMYRATFSGTELTISELALSSEYTATGGTDGSFDNTDVQGFLDISDLNGVAVVHFAGKTYDELRGVITSEYLSSLSYPTAFVQTMDNLDNTLVSSAYKDYLVNLTTQATWDPHIQMHLTVGDGYFDYANVSPYWSSLAPIYAAILAYQTVGTSMRAINVRKLTPHFDKTSLDALADAGFVGFTRCISKGSVVYRGVTSIASWSATTFLAYHAVARRLSYVVEPLIGTYEVKRDSFEADIDSALASIRSLRRYGFSVDYRPGVIHITVNITAVGEVRSIEFGIGVRTNATIYNTP